MSPGKEWTFVEAEAWQMGLNDAFGSDLLPPDDWGADRLWVGNSILPPDVYVGETDCGW